VPTQPTIDIVVCSDKYLFVGVLSLIRSVIRHTEHPEAISFHILTGPGESSELLALIRRSFPRPAFAYEIREFRPCYPVLERYIQTAKGVQRNGIPYRAAAMNCSRFYLSHIYPELDKVIYLDPDTIAQTDVAELYREASLESYDLAGVPRGRWGGPVDKDSVYFRHIDFERPVFNAGVFAARLAKWREKDVVSRFEHWMDLWSNVQEELAESLFYFGSQAVMVLVFYEDFQPLSRKWNYNGLGWRETLPETELREAGILHWTGLRKPWTPQGLHKEYWREYAGVESFATSRRSPSNHCEEV
jgi:lipopolysaccharide biosynthesis glycosyltransferase